MPDDNVYPDIDPQSPTRIPISIPIPPRTPSFSRTETPVSSPLSPKTPHGRVRFRKDYIIAEEGLDMDDESSVQEEGKMAGGGGGVFGPIGVGMAGESSRAGRMRASPKRVEVEIPEVEVEQEEEDVGEVEFPEDAELRSMRARLEEMETEREWIGDNSIDDRVELSQMVSDTKGIAGCQADLQ
jgi:hypothetical protein